MQAEQILEHIQATGGRLALIDGKLKGKCISPEIRSFVKGHKSEIIHLLKHPPVEANLKPCLLCQGVLFVHGKQGGYFCQSCQPVHNGKPVEAGKTRKPSPGNQNV